MASSTATVVVAGAAARVAWWVVSLTRQDPDPPWLVAANFAAAQLAAGRPALAFPPFSALGSGPRPSRADRAVLVLSLDGTPWHPPPDAAVALGKPPCCCNYHPSPPFSAKSSPHLFFLQQVRASPLPQCRGAAPPPPSCVLSSGLFGFLGFPPKKHPHNTQLRQAARGARLDQVWRRAAPPRRRSVRGRWASARCS
jgi:hypothetical protein